MKKGICKQGHIINENNCYQRKDGTKCCRICALNRNTKRDNDPIKYRDKLEKQKIAYYQDKEKRCKQNRERWNKNKEKYNLQQRESRPDKVIRIKTDVLTHYGNGKLACVCCGQEGIIFLGFYPNVGCY